MAVVNGRREWDDEEGGKLISYVLALSFAELQDKSGTYFWRCEFQ